MASSTALTTNSVTLAKSGENSQQTPTKTAASTAIALIQQQQSPRNTGGGGGAITTGSSGTCVQWGPVEVSKAMQDGEKFVKWDEVRFITVR